MGPKETKWGLAALGASVVLHCALVAWVGFRPAPVEPAHEVSAEFVFLEPQKPPPPEETPPEPEPAPKPLPPAVKAPPQVKPLPRLVPVPTPPPETNPTPDRPIDRPTEDVPRAQVTLVPGGNFALSLDAGVEITLDAPTPGPEGPGAAERSGGLTRQGNAR